MNNFVLGLRKVHRVLTIPMVILIILKTISANSAYESTVTYKRYNKSEPKIDKTPGKK